MFTNDTELVFLGIRQGVGKNSGNPYKVLMIADPAKFENYEYFIGDDVTLPPLEQQEKVVITLEMTKRGFNNVPTLRGVHKWSEARKPMKV